MHGARQPDGFNIDNLRIFLQSSAPGWSDRVEDPSPAGVFTLSDPKHTGNTAGAAEIQRVGMQLETTTQPVATIAENP